MASMSFVGTWEVEKCLVDGNSGTKSGLEGARFVLDENGDVTWNPSTEDTSNIPLFLCENYEVSNEHAEKGTIIKFGTFDGEVIEFIAEPPDPGDRVTFRCDKWCILYCVKVRTNDQDVNPNDQYTLLPAVEEGFFSDMIIEAQDHKQFHVHASILGLLGTDMCWMTDPAPFTGLPEPVVGSVLHWLYAECLPPDMTEELAHQVIDSVKQYPCLATLTQHCHIYLKNMALKQRIVDIMSDMHTCINNIIEYFAPEECLGAHPTKLCLVVKQSFRETAVVLVKLVILCEVFTKKKSELSKEEKQEIVRYVRSRVPVFMGQLRRMLEALSTTLSTMTHTQRQELATYIVPEIEAILTTISTLVFKVKVALEQIMQALSPNSGSAESNSPFATEEVLRNTESSASNTADNALAESLRNVFRLRELSKLKNIHKKVSFTFMHLLFKKESFVVMSDSNKLRSVMRNLELLIEELPIFLLKLDEVAAAMDERLERKWRDFFCFKVASSKISGVLNKLLLHKDTLHEVITNLCALVERDSFTQGLVILGMLPEGALGTQQKASTSNASTNSNSNKQHGYKLSLVQTLMKSPPAYSSALSKAASRLLKSERYADMVFEIPLSTPVQAPALPLPNIPAKKTNHLMSPTELQKSSVTNESSNATTAENGTEDSDTGSTNNSNTLGDSDSYTNSNSVIIKAHRVIVAARCDWFRRALQSGMKEAIHRKILIHDTTPALFRKLLYYLYTGKLDTRVSTPEQLTELILLGDRYELDAMKLACEKALALNHLDRETTFYYLTLADQYNATHLKDACIKYILYEHGMLDCPEFGQLPPSLQTAVYSVLDSYATPPACLWPPNLFCRPPSPYGNLIKRSSLDETSNSDGSSVGEISVDRLTLNDCLARLRDVLGPDVPLEDLNRVALAADCDANRAINFYYSQAQSSSHTDLGS